MKKRDVNRNSAIETVEKTDVVTYTKVWVDYGDPHLRSPLFHSFLHFGVTKTSSEERRRSLGASADRGVFR